MGRRVYLNDAELEVIREALVKWENWAWENITETEQKAFDSLILKGLTTDV